MGRPIRDWPDHVRAPCVLLFDCVLKCIWSFVRDMVAIAPLLRTGAKWTHWIRQWCIFANDMESESSMACGIAHVPIWLDLKLLFGFWLRRTFSDRPSPISSFSFTRNVVFSPFSLLMPENSPKTIIKHMSQSILYDERVPYRLQRNRRGEYGGAIDM